jgi:hypothetical protein
MPTRESILTLVRSGLDYRQIGRQLGISPGRAYLTATGLPADGGDALGPEADRPEGVLAGSTQHLANSAAVRNPRTEQVVDEWMRQRAASDPALRAAWATHPVAPPPVAEKSDDVIDIIGHDHAQVRYLQQQLQMLPAASAGALPDDLRRRAEALARLRPLLQRHEHAEAEVFWPLVETHLADGGDFARDGLAQEHKLDELFAELDGTAPADRSTSKYDDLVTELVGALRKHLALEDAVLARLYDEMTEAEGKEAGRRFQTARLAAERVRGVAQS